VTAAGDSCSWTNGSTTANPPSALTIEADTINSPGGNLSWTDGASATPNNNPDLTFDSSVRAASPTGGRSGAGRAATATVGYRADWSCPTPTGRPAGRSAVGGRSASWAGSWPRRRGRHTRRYWAAK
jgi:hypothetical protein